MAKKKNINLAKYVSDSSRFVSVFKSVPISYLDSVREAVKEAAMVTESIESAKLKVRMRFRGPRFWNSRDTLKMDAEAFDVYVDTKTFPAKASSKKREEIKNVNREIVKEIIVTNSPTIWQ